MFYETSSESHVCGIVDHTEMIAPHHLLDYKLDHKENGTRK